MNPVAKYAPHLAPAIDSSAAEAKAQSWTQLQKSHAALQQKMASGGTANAEAHQAQADVNGYRKQYGAHLAQVQDHLTSHQDPRATQMLQDLKKMKPGLYAGPRGLPDPEAQQAHQKAMDLLKQERYKQRI